MTKKEPNQNKGISRIDTQNTKGWFARIYYDPKVEIRKFFSDALYNGYAKALDAAKRWRAAYLKAHPLPEHLANPKPFKTIPPSNNKSGVVGVHETFQRWNGKKWPCYQVSWMTSKGKKKHKSFWFHHFDSPAQAFAEATDFRKEKERERLMNR